MLRDFSWDSLSLNKICKVQRSIFISINNNKNEFRTINSKSRLDHYVVLSSSVFNYVVSRCLKSNRSMKLK